MSPSGTGACEHIEAIDDVKHPKRKECEDCVKIGAWWVHLRTCQQCGGTRCCDSSPNKHASKHAHATGHPVIASGEDANLRGSWAFVCAGGSMPDLPRTTDPRLLAAIPKMQPWPGASTNRRWVLREPGRQYLVCSTDKSELDLSAESGSFQLQAVDARTGQVATRSEIIQAGKIVNLPPGIIWLEKD